MKKTLIINQGNINSNLGDLAIRENLKSIFDDNSLHCEFAFLTDPRSRQEQIPTGTYFPNIKKKANVNPIKALIFKVINFFYWGFKNYSHIKTIAKSGEFNTVIIGGGQLINASHQYYPHSFAIAIFWWTLIIKLFSNAQIVLYGVGVDSGFNRIEKYLYQSSLRRIDQFFLRDVYSQKQMKRVFNKESILMPDVAFYKDMSFPIERDSKLMLFGIYSFKEFDENYNEKNISKEDYYLQNKELVKKHMSTFRVQLFSTTTTDYLESVDFQKYLNEHGIDVLISNVHSLNELDQLLLSATQVYSARMHALILAFKANCICDPCLISQKLVSFYEDYLKKNNISELKNRVKISFEDLKSNYLI